MKKAFILYLTGLLFYLIALFLSNQFLLVRNLLYTLTVLFSGYHVIAEGLLDTVKESKKHRKFLPNVHLLMILAAIGAMIINNFHEAALLILIFAGAHYLEDYAEGKSKREMTALLKLKPQVARKISTNGDVKEVPTDTLEIGDILEVLPGQQVPIDGKITKGEGVLNEASISGENLPQEKAIGDEVIGATINEGNRFEMEVTKDLQDTLFSKILQLVESSQQNLSKEATKIKKLEPIYVNTVLVLYPIVLLLGPTLFKWSFDTTLYRSMVFLIAASPCALAASAVPATLSALSNLAKRGVLFKGGAYLANFPDIKGIAFDKTGTLTAGKPEVTDEFLIGDKEFLRNIIYSMERQANHPLAKAVVNYYESEPQIKNLPIEVENLIGKGLTTTYEKKTYHLGKPTIFNNVPTMIEEKQQDLAASGKTVVYLAENEEVIGLLAFMDLPHEGSQAAIQYFNEENIETILLTGDNKKTGEAVGSQLQLKQVLADVLPEEKANAIKKMQQKYDKIAMVGDGVNDAPALVTADLGVAMGEGTDVAIEVADAVLMKNDLRRLVYAHRLAKKLNRIVWQNIFFSLFMVLILVTFNFLGKMNIGIGVIGHEGSTILVILNGLRLLIPLKENH